PSPRSPSSVTSLCRVLACKVAAPSFVPGRVIGQKRIDQNLGRRPMVVHHVVLVLVGLHVKMATTILFSRPLLLLSPSPLLSGSSLLSASSPLSASSLLGGIPWRLARRMRKCVPQLANDVSRLPGSRSALKLKRISAIAISTTASTRIVHAV